MRVQLLQDVYLHEVGWLRIGEVDVPDGLAAALVYQGNARRLDREVGASEVKAAVLPRRAKRSRGERS